MNRFLQLDALRGLFLVIMTLDHFDSPFKKILYEKIGYFTAAEGFILLSGIVAGIVYGKIQGSKLLLEKSLMRAIKIYRYHIITMVLLFIVVNVIKSYGDFWSYYAPAFINYSLPGIISGFLIIYDPHPIDVLPLYLFLILLMPFLLMLLKKGMSKLYWIVTISLWIVGSLVGHDEYFFRGSFFGFLPIDLGYFNFLSWQLLFFIGIYFGFRKQLNSSFSPKFSKPTLIIATIVLLAFIFIRYAHHLDIEMLNSEIKNLLFNKSKLGIGRLINFITISYLVAYLLMRFKNIFRYSWLIILGQNSIKVFTAHVVTMILFYSAVPLIQKYGMIWNVLFSLAMLIPLYLIIYIIPPLKKTAVVIRKQ